MSDLNNPDSAFGGGFPGGEPSGVSPLTAGAPAPTEEMSSFRLAAQHRRMVSDMLRDGAFPMLLPDRDGNVDVSPAVNAVNGTMYKGPNVLILKAHQASRGFPTAEYVSVSQLEEASRKAGTAGITIPDPHPVTISVLDTDHPGRDGKPPVKFIRLYNIAEAAHPGAVRELAKERAAENERRFNEWQEKKAGEALEKGEDFKAHQYYPPHGRQNGRSLNIRSADPKTYIATVFSAMTLGSRRCTVNPRIADTFKENMVDYLYAKDIGKDGRSYTNPYRLYSLGNDASRCCRDILKNMYPKQEQNRNRARESQNISM
jgi:hypothetical protein